MKKCSHPNIVELKEVLDDVKSNKIYLVLEYLSRGEIAWQTEEGEPKMSMDQARQVARDVTSGLEYLHFQGIIHRDIKPANLLRDEQGKVKISDFGVSYASSLGQYDDDELELAKTAGTPAFFAPELCVSTLDERRPPVTHKIDVWAFGVTLYCLLFGKVPFIAESEFELFDVIVNQPLTFPDEEQPQKSKGESALPPSMFYNLHNPSDSTQSSLSVESVVPAKVMTFNPELESAKDLLRHVLEKDPTKRYDLIDVKQHPWMLQGMDISNQELFLTTTSDQQKIEVSNEEVQAAVLGIAGRIKRGLSKFGSHALHITGLRRKGSTSSSSSFTQSSSTSTSRSNSKEPPRSRRGSRDVHTSKRISFADDQVHYLPSRPVSGTPQFNESLFNMLDRELGGSGGNKSANSSSTSLSSFTSVGNSPRVSWKRAYAGGSEIAYGHHRGSSVSSRTMQALSDRPSERRASEATVASSSTQDSFPMTDIETGMAFMSVRPPRGISASNSHLNINSLLTEPDPKEVPEPLPSGLETPKAVSASKPQSIISQDLDLTPGKSFCPSPKSPPSPISPTSPGRHPGEGYFAEQPIMCPPGTMYATPPAYEDLAVRTSTYHDSDKASSDSSSDDDDDDDDEDGGSELVLNVGPRPNAPSSIARRLAARNSESNLRTSITLGNAGSAGSSRLAMPGHRAVSASVPASPVVGALGAGYSGPAGGAGRGRPLNLSPLGGLGIVPGAGGRLAAVKSAHAHAYATITPTPLSTATNFSPSPVASSPSPSPSAPSPSAPNPVRIFKGGLEPGLESGLVAKTRARSQSVAVGEIQHLRSRDNFGLDEDD